MTISDLQKQAHEIAKSKGWWDKPRSWEEIVCLIHSEISEAFEEYRAGRMEVYYDKAVSQLRDNGTHGWVLKPEGFPIELADIVIRLMDWAEHEGMRFPSLEQLAINELRDMQKIQSQNTITYLFKIHECLHDYSISGTELNLFYCLSRVFGLAGFLHIDLESAITLKMEYNKGRSYRHGGKKA